MITKHVVIKGNVQGVFFRATAKEKADQCGLGGWVKNTEEGHVELKVSGVEQSVSQFIDWCRQGPSYASVSEVDVADVPQEHFRNFTILRG